MDHPYYLAVPSSSNEGVMYPGKLVNDASEMLKIGRPKSPSRWSTNFGCGNRSYPKGLIILKSPNRRVQALSKSESKSRHSYKMGGRTVSLSASGHILGSEAATLNKGSPERTPRNVRLAQRSNSFGSATGQPSNDDIPYEKLSEISSKIDNSSKKTLSFSTEKW